ncbi:hypothetical protein E6W39_29305 [Kitasatospora acidiphila]|uniref:Uncharacterized protein n=1 Tax=Kitasatospora acidiphila TaxID=2567942 RepID=A0A540W997_9ACTN|nr:hypothetical protein [Kitasatospora acidiphila]TQF05583.1 hypothetical protein E6W39_29305 [Kitasatospora acidiphila]
MGYDLYTANPPRPNAIHPFRVAFDGGLGSLVDRQQRHDIATGYFRIGYFEMPSLIGVMTEVGIVDTTVPAPAWPTADDYGLTFQDLNAPQDQLSDAKKTAVESFHSHIAAVRGGEQPEPAGIPAYKLDSNDLWLVTPCEIRAALAAYRRQEASVQDDLAARIALWRGWIAYLEVAKDCGGFRVH